MPLDFKHGRGGYSNHGCRCDVCKTEMSACQKAWRKANIDEIKVKDRKRNADRSDLMKDYLKEYYVKNKLKLLVQTKEWRKNNNHRVNRVKSFYERNRRWNDPAYRLLKNLRVRMGHAIARGSKSARTMILLGCSIEELKNRLALKFVDGMSWDNYGEWSIDHVIPCAAFNLRDPLHQKACFNWRNLQPLWKKDNQKKSGSVLPGTDVESYVNQFRESVGNAA